MLDAPKIVRTMTAHAESTNVELDSLHQEDQQDQREQQEQQQMRLDVTGGFRRAEDHSHGDVSSNGATAVVVGLNHPTTQQAYCLPVGEPQPCDHARGGEPKNFGIEEESKEKVTDNVTSSQHQLQQQSESADGVTSMSGLPKKQLQFSLVHSPNDSSDEAGNVRDLTTNSPAEAPLCRDCQKSPCGCCTSRALEDEDDLLPPRDETAVDIENEHGDEQSLLLHLQHDNQKMRKSINDLQEKFNGMENRARRTNRRSMLLMTHAPAESSESEMEDIGENRKRGGLFPSFSGLLSRRKGKAKEEGLPQDSFAFMVVAPVFSIPFLSAITLFAIQITAFMLLTINLIDSSNPKNHFGIPENVKPAVRATQLVALTITVLTQDDIRTGLNQINNGYNPQTIGKAFPHGASRAKWTFSVCARCLEGALSLVVTFLLIATSGTVLDLLLNFTAMEFVSQLDELFFTLAQQGFVGKHNYLQAEAISTTYFSVTKKPCHVSPFLLLIVTMFTMLTGWTVLMLRQTSGHYLCDTVFVQFGDDFVPALGAFSGLYDRERGHTGMFSDERVRYIDRMSGKASISYCLGMGMWVFTYQADEGDVSNVGQCHWHTKSEATHTYNLLDAADLKWFARNGQDMEVELDRMYMSCYDCDQMDASNACEGRGTCSGAVCSCRDRWNGMRCQYPKPCPTLDMDARYGGFLGTRDWSSAYSLLEDSDQSVIVYDRPVYVNEFKPGQFDMLLFIGRRWVATTSSYFNSSASILNSTDPRKVLSDYLMHDFHAFWSDIDAVFISSPTDLETPSDIGTPIGLDWYYATATKGIYEKDLQAPDVSAGTQSAHLLCTLCSDINPCFYGSECIDDGSCKCHEGAQGQLCQIPPIGNGHCDEIYNSPEFSNDGGDCCETTCISSRDYSCGKDHTGFVDVGYFFCPLPVQVWHLHGDALQGEPYTRLGTSVSLSANGRTLLVGEPEANRVLLYDKDGSEWIVRGRPMEGPIESQFGSYVAMSSGLADAVSNPFSHSSISVVVAAPGAGFIRLYECSTDGCYQSGNDIPGTVVDISDDGNTIVVGSKTNITVYERLDSDTWGIAETKSGFDFIYAVLISGDGKTIAVGSMDYNVTVLSLDDASFQAMDTKAMFYWDGQSLSPKGDPITRRIDFNETFDSLKFSKIGNVAFYRKSMAISENGSTLAVGASTSLVATGVQIFVFLDGSQVWTQQGANVSTSSDGTMLEGQSFALSSDGRIAVGAALSEGEVNDNLIVAFEWNGTDWEVLGEALPGGEDSSVSLSADGSILAVGLPYFNSRMAGSCFVYHYPPVKCPAGTGLFRLSLTMDEYPADNAWDLVSNETGEVLLQGGPYSYLYEQATVVSEVCVPEHHTCTIFSIYDRVDTRLASLGKFSNGMDPPGLYALFVDGVNVSSGNLHGSATRVYLGDCSTTCPPGTQLVSVLIRTCLAYSWDFQNKYSGDMIMQDEVPAHCGNGIDAERSTWKEMCVPFEGCFELSIRAPQNQPDFLLDPSSANSTGSFDPYGSSNEVTPLLKDETNPLTAAPLLLTNPPQDTMENYTHLGGRFLKVAPVNLLFFVYVDGVEIQRAALAVSPGDTQTTTSVGTCQA